MMEDVLTQTKFDILRTRLTQTVLPLTEKAKEKAQAQKAAGVTRKLVGFELIDRGVPRHDYPITDEQGTAIGIVTSGTMAPSVGKAIGMGYVPTEKASPGSSIYVEVRGKLLQAVVVTLPFWKGNQG